jgi:nicotinate-nucleotide adenylyltransferase
VTSGPAAVVRGRLGVLGGTFDPVHTGHLAAAEEAREALGLEGVLFVPAGRPWQKADRPVSEARHRLAMLELAVADNPAFAVSRVEIDRPGPSYSVTTLRDLAAASAAGGADDLWFILSAEALAGLPTWHDPNGLLGLARLAVVPRDGASASADASWFGRTFPGQDGRAVFLDGPRLAISATDIRARVAAGRSIRYYVPAAVAAYIGDHGLYRGPEGRTETT